VSEWPAPRPRPSDAEWDQTKVQFPVGTAVTAPVIARQPFGLLLDLGDGVLGLVELPSPS
jgi:hypothetical protein